MNIFLCVSLHAQFNSLQEWSLPIFHQSLHTADLTSAAAQQVSTSVETAELFIFRCEAFTRMRAAVRAAAVPRRACL